jgi:hypothetical protein
MFEAKRNVSANHKSQQWYQIFGTVPYRSASLEDTSCFILFLKNGGKQ